MSVSPNIRPPCGGNKTTTLIGVGGCFQHYITESAHLPVVTNTTKVPSYFQDHCGDAIDPYHRPEQLTEPSCGPYNQFSDPPYECGNCVNDNPFCGKPDPIVDFIPEPTASKIEVGAYTNYYVTTNLTKSVATCHKDGWKSVAAHKEWQGRRAYNSREYGQPDLFDWCGGSSCEYHSYDPNPDAVRYLTVMGKSSFSHTYKVWCVNSYDGGTIDCGGGNVISNCCTEKGVLTWEGTDTGYAIGTSSVDRYSGNLTCNLVSGSTTFTKENGGCVGQCDDDICYTAEDGCCVCAPTAGTQTDRPQEDIDIALEANANLAKSMLLKLNGSILDLNELWTPPDCGVDCVTCRCSVTGNGSSWSILVEIMRSCSNGDPCNPIYTDEWFPLYSCDIDWSSGTVTRKIYADDQMGELGCIDGQTGCPPRVNSTETLNIQANTYEYSKTGIAKNSKSVYTEWDDSVAGSLSNPYTSEQLEKDVKELLGQFPLDDDDIYPWRTDVQMTMMPIVKRDEIRNEPAIGCTSTTDSTGKIKGKPAPAGITPGVWIPDHKNYCVCSDESSNYCSYQLDWGAWSNELIPVPSATCVTDLYEASNLPVGAMIGNGISAQWGCQNNAGFGQRIVDDGMWAVKTAQILFPRQSFNYARPCGEDRFAISSSSARCITGSSDHVLSLDTNGPVTDINTGNRVWVCGTSDYDGCWIATKDDDYTITLNEPRLVSGSTLPSDPITECGTGMVARLKWRNLQPAICGELDIVSVTKSAPVTISLELPTYLIDDDYIFVVGAIGSNINGYWKVKRIDSKTFALSGSNSTAAPPYQGYGKVYSPYAADWKWNDTQPKNDYTTIQWNYNFRDIGEYTRLKNKAEYNANLNACGTDPCVCYPAPPTQCPGPTVPPEPRAAQGKCFDQTVTSVECKTDCLEWTPCSPVIVAFSPQNEFTNSLYPTRNHGFGSVKYDAIYGSLWQAKIMPIMVDPYWEPPPCPCSIKFYEGSGETHVEQCPDCEWREDDGNCYEDTESPCTKYYAHAPIYESRCEVPAGAPKLAYGNLGCVKVSEFISGSCPNGNYCYGPLLGNAANEVDYAASLGGGYPLQNICPVPLYPYAWDDLDTPWALHQAMINCACAGGRFADQYGLNVLVAGNCSELVPSP